MPLYMFVAVAIGSCYSSKAVRDIIENDRNCPQFCPMIYMPLYDFCMMKAAKCRTARKEMLMNKRNVLLGKCSYFCPMIYKPVYDSDGKMYSNECMMRKAKCNAEKSSSSDLKLSKREQCPEVCFDLWDPVCGSNGKTYSNTCFLSIANCHATKDGKLEVKAAKMGEC